MFVWFMFCEIYFSLVLNSKLGGLIFLSSHRSSAAGTWPPHPALIFFRARWSILGQPFFDDDVSRHQVVYFVPERNKMVSNVVRGNWNHNGPTVTGLKRPPGGPIWMHSTQKPWIEVKHEVNEEYALVFVAA